MPFRLFTPRMLPWLGALLGAAAASVVMTIEPRLGFLLLALPFIAFGVVTARQAPLQQRALFLGVVIGCGQLATTFAGGGIVPLILIGALAVALPAPRPGFELTNVLWAAAAAILVSSLVFTSAAANVNTTVWLSLAAILVAAAWSFGIDDRDAAMSSGLLVLQTAGAICGVFVIISYGLGHSLVTATEEETFNTLVAATGTVRGTGPFPSANEAGMVLSSAILATLMGLLQTGRRPSIPRLQLSALGIAATALVLTGSRASLLAAIVGGLVLLASLVFRRGTVATLIAGCGIFAFWLAQQAGTLSGRSLNPFATKDISAYYRHRIQDYLFAHVDWTAVHGYGFQRGLVPAKNPVVGTFANIDEAWLFVAITLGGLCVLGFALLCAAMLQATARVNVVFGVAGLVWLAASSSAENLFLDAVPCVCAVLLLGSVGATVRRTASGESEPVAAETGRGRLLSRAGRG